MLGLNSAVDDLGTASGDTATLGDIAFAATAGTVVSLSSGCLTLSPCAVFSTGKIRCWGSGHRGLLGQGSSVNWGDHASVRRTDALPAIVFAGCGGGNREVAEACDDGNTVSGDGCSADCSAIEAGFACSTAVPNVCYRPDSVASGYSFSCALHLGVGVRCFGNMIYLGSGATQDIGDAPGETAAIQPIPFHGDFGAQVVQVQVGNAHSCVRSSTGKVACFGNNGFGELGIVTASAAGVGCDPATPCESTNTLHGIMFETGDLATALSVGGGHACAVFDASGTGKVRCWGWGAFGQLGYNSAQSQGAGGAGFIPYITFHSTLNSVSVEQISCGASFSCALFLGGSVVCWGGGSSGELGNGGTAAVGDDPARPMTSATAIAGITASQISCGSGHSCAITAGMPAQIRCWGNNNDGI